MVSADRFPISGNETKEAVSLFAIADAISPKGRIKARRALRFPIPLTVVKSWKNSRSRSQEKPTSRGMNEDPCDCPSNNATYEIQFVD